MIHLLNNNFKELNKYYFIFLLIIFNLFFSFKIIYSIKNNYESIYNYFSHTNQIIKSINKYIILCRYGKLNKKFDLKISKPKISSIVILYNSEKTIKSAIRSIQFQNISEIEILIIDDYSTDSSINIIEELASDDSRIKLIKNNKNRGSLYSRSIGALAAEAEYIMALDSDDIFINENLFNICYEEINQNNLDIIEFAGFHIKGPILKINNKFPKKPYYLRFKPYNKIIKQPSLFYNLYKRNETHIIRLNDAYIWGKCIRKQIYKKTLDKLGENIYNKYLNFGEDRIVNFILFQIANNFKYINIYGIIYYNNSLSIYNSYKKELITRDELFNLMNMYNNTKNSRLINLLIYEVKFRWDSILKEGLNEENKKKIKYLLELLVNDNYTNLSDKKILINYTNEI